MGQVELFLLFDRQIFGLCIHKSIYLKLDRELNSHLPHIPTVDHRSRCREMIVATTVPP